MSCIVVAPIACSVPTKLNEIEKRLAAIEQAHRPPAAVIEQKP